MYLCEAEVLEAHDIGEALSGVKEVLRETVDGQGMMEIALMRVPHIAQEQLLAWRLHCRQLVMVESRHVQVHMHACGMHTLTPTAAHTRPL